MSEARTTDQFPLHIVYGENAPKSVIVVLVAAGLLLAGLSLWLSQDSIFDVQDPIVKDVPAETRSITSQGASIQSTVQLQPASTPVVASDNRPICPGLFSFYFATRATSPLAEDAREGFDAVVDWVRRHPSAKLFIEGHADVVGVDEYNVLLSYQRAKVVASLLEKSGVAPQQIQISAMGSNGLISGIPGDAQGNRRVNVQINDTDNCRPKSD
ncbi:MAG: OmpA family protein [Gallionella sp.]